MALALCPWAVARADDPRPEAPRLGAVILEGQTGARAPLGQLGLALDVEALPWLSISGGYGSKSVESVGDTNQLLFMPRLRTAFERVPGLGASAGLGVEHGERASNGDTGTRLDAELSLEARTPGGLRVRLFGGAGQLLSKAAPTGGAGLPATTAYAGAALGYAFWPNPMAPPERSWSLGRWYGWQILGLDALGASMFWLPRSYGYDDTYDRDHAAAREAVLVYAISGPAVHVAHRRYGRAAASVAVRLAGPLLLGTLGGRSATGDAGQTAAVPGLAAGAVISSLVDALALGWEPEPAPASVQSVP